MVTFTLRCVRILCAATVLALVAMLGTTPAIAESADDAATVSPSASVDPVQVQSQAAIASNDVVVAPSAVPDVYRVCAPSGKCIHVEKVRYCAPNSDCGRSSLQPWTGGVGNCSPSVGCAIIRGRPYLVMVRPYDNGEQDRINKCMASLAMTGAEFVTRGFSRLALAGAGVSAWGCT